MNTIFQYTSFIKKFTLAVGFSVLLLCIRIIKTESAFFLFLVWNLFLACIPFGITLLLGLKRQPLYIFLPIFFIWLIFLPNSPYILTDLQHLRISSLSSIWFDVLLILSFAINGLIIGFASLQMMQQELRYYFSQRNTHIIISIILLLCGFGIYLGRVLRWNSWDLLQSPLDVIADIAKRMLFPIKHIDTWAFTLGFGVFLLIIYHIILPSFKPNKEIIK